MSEATLPSGWLKSMLSQVIQPRGEKFSPVGCDHLQFIGMDHVEAQTTKIIGTVSAGSMKSSAARFYAGDVLYGRLRPYLNKVAQPNFDGLASAEFIVFPDTILVHSKFLKFRLNAADFVSFASHLNEGDRPRVSFDQIGDFEISVPPPQEQHRIVAKIEELFSELDKGIENLKTARAQLKVYRQALLKHAFEGKLTAQWRTENQDKLETAAALLKRIQQARVQRYQQQLANWEATGKPGSKPKAPKPLPPLTAEELAGLPELPEGWGWVRLGDIFSDSPKNGIYKSADNYGSGFSIIRIDDFYDGTLCRTSGFKRVKLSADEIKTFTAHIGDILINRVNSIEYLGKCCEIRGLAEPVVFESNIMKTTLAANLASNFFVTSYLSSHFGRRRLCANAKHAVNQASINQTDVSLTPIPLAQLGEQIVISELLGANLSEVDQLDQTLATALQQAEALRQSILKKAFAGLLVPQDPHDEPASKLLARIQVERAVGAKNAPTAAKPRKPGKV